jgi:putative oxidoreductase
VMTAAVITVHWEKGPFNTEGGYEFNLTLVAAAFALSGVGPGEWSLDNVLGVDWTGTGWALIALGAGILGGIGAVIQGRASGTDRVDQAPPAAV